MFTKLSLFGAAAAMTLTAVVPATAADAKHKRRHHEQSYQRNYDRDYDRNYRREYRGDDGYASYRAQQKCKDGDGGTIIGAIAGGLLGNVIAGRGDKTVGAVLGAAGGALAGRAIDRSDRPAYCRR